MSSAIPIEEYKDLNQTMINIERQIADKIASANGMKITQLGLRFDKVAIRLLGHLKKCLEGTHLREETLLMTITAPIQQPARTANEIEVQVKLFLDSKNRSRDKIIKVFQNEVRIRVVENSSKLSGKFVGLVHNPDTDAKWLLNFATQWLLVVQ